MKQLNHPNIVGFIDFVISTNNIYIITEYCNGPDLK
jgi:serine/threonine-protein kinase ULK/ATG1